MTSDEIKTKLRANEVERRRLRAELRRLEPRKRAKAKHKSASKRQAQAREAWDAFRQGATECEACGLSRGQSPSWWLAGNPLDPAHVVSQPRIEDPRTCIILCRSCHSGQHGVKAAGSHLPRLTLGNLHWLKMQHADYDPAFLRRHNGGKALPEPEELPAAYSLYRERFGR